MKKITCLSRKSTTPHPPPPPVHISYGPPLTLFLSLGFSRALQRLQVFQRFGTCYVFLRQHQHQLYVLPHFGTASVFIRAQYRLHVFPRFGWHRLHVFSCYVLVQIFPRLAPVARFPALCFRHFCFEFSLDH